MAYGRMKMVQGGLRIVRACLLLLLMAVILLSSPIFVHLVVASTSSSYNSVDITRLAPPLQGYVQEIHPGFSDYMTFLESIGCQHATDYLWCDYHGTMGSIGVLWKGMSNHTMPVQFINAYYTDSQSGKIVLTEIYEFNSTDDAHAIYYNAIAAGYGYIFQRWSTPSVLFHRDRFLVFAMSEDKNTHDLSILSDVAQKLIDNLFNVVSGSNLPPQPPSVNTINRVVWGVMPGDSITWKFNRTTFTGYVGGGMGHSDDKNTINMQIVQITNDKSAILIKLSNSTPSDFEYKTYQWSQTFVLPTDKYFWATGPVQDPDVSTPWPLIYPTYYIGTGQTLNDAIRSDYNQITEDDVYIRGHSQTAPGSGYTPTLTQWADITVHKGSGIVTAASFYYNNNQNYITTSSGLSITNINFNLNGRLPPSTPIPVPSTVPTAKPSSTSNIKPTSTPALNTLIVIILICIAACLRLRKI